MVVLLLLAFCPFIAAQSFVYLHPVNPQLHPRDMYPIQKSLRGLNKVRDLPASGIVYIDRIKPISEDFRGVAARANNTFVPENAPTALRVLNGGSAKVDAPTPTRGVDVEPQTVIPPALPTQLDTKPQVESAPMPVSGVAVESQKSTETDYTVYDDSHPKENSATAAIASNSGAVEQVMDSASILPAISPVTAPDEEMVTEVPTMPTIRRTTTKETGFTSKKPEKNLLKVAISKRTKNVGPPKPYDLSREAQIDLERLIEEVKAQEKVDMIDENPSVSTIDMPKAALFSERTYRHGSPSAKLVSLSRTARIHTGQIIRKPNKAKLIQLRKKKKSFGKVGAAPRRGPDFDPWERMGQ